MQDTQEITLLIEYRNETEIYFSTLEKSVAEDSWSRITPKTVQCHSVTCQSCDQELQINLFWVQDFKRNLDEKRSHEADNLSEDVLEKNSKNNSKIAQSKCKYNSEAKIIKKKNYGNALKQQSLQQNSEKVFTRKWGNSKQIITNFDLSLNKCDICGKKKEKRSYFDLLKHRATHFVGRRNNQHSPYYCIACNMKFKELSDIEFHTRTCENRLDLIENFKKTQNKIPVDKIFIPNDILLPDISKIKDAHYEVVNQPDGTKAYIQKLGRQAAVRITNFDPLDPYCDLCGLQSKDLKHLIAHRKLHFFQISTDETCIGCKKHFPQDDHVGHSYYCKFKHKINVLECGKCHHVSVNYKAHRHHISSKHGPNQGSYRPNVMCHLCSKIIKKELLELHLRRHNTEDGKALQCAHCIKRFVSISGLKGHLIEVHFNHLAKHKCHLCSSIFYSFYNFEKHLTTKHPIGKSINLVCKICKKKFKDPHAFKRHEKCHTTPAKKFICVICSKTFLTKFSMKKHSYIHLNDSKKPYQCKYCSRGFITKQYLLQHELGHTNSQELFYCDICGKGVKTKASLKNHLRGHTGETPYQCQICNKKFSDQSNYRSHLKGHEVVLGIKLTYTTEERRLIKIGLMQPHKLSS